MGQGPHCGTAATSDDLPVIHGSPYTLPGFLAPLSREGPAFPATPVAVIPFSVFRNFSERKTVTPPG
uniref:Uncharacterized protein n=1 Tax=uncultured prokaryote TaxID=198431 RepID=A0A0H5Q0A1_9ZZZZ|nr:hypothetical protein [uncultured prokaryote]